MPKAITKYTGHAHVSSKIHRYLKKQAYTKISLKDIQQSLSNIGVSLSKRVIGARVRKKITFMNFAPLL